jgi:hypothetical protein
MKANIILWLDSLNITPIEFISAFKKESKKENNNGNL